MKKCVIYEGLKSKQIYAASTRADNKIVSRAHTSMYNNKISAMPVFE